MDCEVQFPQESKYTRPELTVGREFYISCRGEFSSVLSEKDVELTGAAAASPFTLRILGVHKKSDSELDFLVTTYQVGKVNLPQFSFKSQEKEFVSSQGLGWETISLVQEQEQKGVKVEPYGPFGPFYLSFSYVIIIYLVAWAALLFGGLVYLSWSQHRRKKLLQSTPFLASYKPLVEFQKTIRTFQRTNDATLKQDLRRLDQSWRIYWTRRFEFPALFWSERRLIADFKNDYLKIYKSNPKRIDNFLGEMRKIRKSEIEPQIEEFQKLVRETRVFIEWIDESVEGTSPMMRRRRK